MHAAKLALEISVGYAAFSFLCGGVWIALVEFIKSDPSAAAAAWARRAAR